MNGKIEISCPPMPVTPTALPRVHETTQLACPVTITLDDGTVIAGVITYPPTPVRFVSVGYWLVDQVTATGTLANGDDIAVTLQPEGVERDGVGRMVALEVNGVGAIWSKGVIIAKIALVSPQVLSKRTGIGYEVDACVETGTVTGA